MAPPPLPPGTTTTPPALPPGTTTEPDTQNGSSDPAYNPVEDFVHGLSSGVAGDIVGAGQLVRHVLPDNLTNLIANSRLSQGLEREAQRPSQGIAGEVGSFLGSTAPFMVAPELSAARGWGPAARVMTRSTIPAALQPVNPNDPDYWRTKAVQTGAGTVAGEALHGLGSLGARALRSIRNTQFFKSLSDMVEDINRQIRDENATRQTRYQTRRDRTQNINQRIQTRNEAIGERYQQAQDAQRQQAYQQRLIAQQTRERQAAVPQNTTRQWWRETLASIGEQARTPDTVGPESSAQVQRIIGTRLNELHNQMSLSTDTNFGTVLRDRVAGTLNAANRRDWNQMFSEAVSQPLMKNHGRLNGQQLHDLTSDLGNRIEELSRRIRSEDMPESRRTDLTRMRNALRNVADAVEDQATGTPEVKAQLQQARRAYNLWSIGNGATAAERGGEMTPGRIAREWAGRQGDAAYGAEMNRGSPRYHPENARLKTWLESQRQLHETGPAPAAPQPPVPRPTTKWSEIPLPRKPVPVKQGPMPPPPPRPERSPGAEAVKAVGRKLVAGHLGGLPGVIMEPLATAGARRLARSPTVARGLSQAGRAGPVAAVGASQSIPEIVVTAPRYRSGEDQETK